MDDSEKMWTVEITFDRPVKGPQKDLSQPARKEDPPPALSENQRGQFTLTGEKEKEDLKKLAFLRLRDTVFNMNQGPVNNTFLEQAKKYEYTDAKPSPPVSFLCYWPTYDVMSKSQLDWYFYWRELVRNKIYPHTTLSYIFLYIYELINEVGIESPEDGLIKICSVWSAYRKTYNSLDRYLKNWIYDYIEIHFGQTLPEGPLNQITDREIKKLLPDGIIIESILLEGEDSPDAGLIYDYVLKYSSYNIEKSKFFQTGDQDFIRTYLTGVIIRLNGYMVKKTQKGIFQSYSNQGTKRRMPYQNAVYQGNVKSIEYGRYSYGENKVFKDFLADIVKSAENSLRKLVNHKGKLKTELNAEYVRFIDKYVSQRQKNEIIENRSRVEIDKTKVNEIIVHSDIIREKLLSGIESNEAEEAFTPPVIPVREIRQAESIDASFPSSGSQAFYENLTSTQKEILLFIKEKNTPVSLSELTGKFNGIFVQTEIDFINEVSLEYLGDIIILSDNDSFTVQDIL